MIIITDVINAISIIVKGVRWWRVDCLIVRWDLKFIKVAWWLILVQGTVWPKGSHAEDLRKWMVVGQDILIMVSKQMLSIYVNGTVSGAITFFVSNAAKITNNSTSLL